MTDKIYKIIDEIENSDIIKKLNDVKEEIKNNDNALLLIKKFNDSKAIYEKYGYDKEFIKDKINLMEDKLIKRYLEIQKEVNIITIHINKKIEEITKNTTCKK